MNKSNRTGKIQETKFLDTMSKTAVLRQSKRLVEIKSKKEKGGREARFEKKSEENVWNLKRTEEESAKKRKRTKMEFEKSESGELSKKRKRSMTNGDNYVCLQAKPVASMKVKVIRRKKAEKEKWICEWTLPVPALEKVFSYLDWKELGKAMLVCQRWHEVGGHPSLWTQFPLQLASKKLKSIAKIRRLGWVKSVTLNASTKKSLVYFVGTAVESFSRLEELFILFDNKNISSEFNDSKVYIQDILRATNFKLQQQSSYNLWSSWALCN